MTIQEVATQLVALVKEGKFREAVDALYADDAVSLEAHAFGGMPRDLKGKAAILAKNDSWLGANEVHSLEVDGPYVSPEFFAVIYVIEVTCSESKQRAKFREVALYTVADGKVKSDQFLMAVE